MTYDPAKPTPEQLFALMDDAAMRMNDSMAQHAARVMTPGERAEFLHWFVVRNDQLRETLKRLDGEAERMQAETDEHIARINAKLDETRARMDRELAKWSTLRRLTTWIGWAGFWISGYFAHGAIERFFP
jgi:hypothetical protein